jgi:MYXO-CTERM domain-containing protein
MNPDLNTTPSDANASVVIDMAAIEARATEINNAGGAIVPFGGAEGAILSFDRLRFFAGQEALPRKTADWLVDELRVGDTFGDVTPHAAPAAAAIPEPGAVTLAALGFVVVLRTRRRHA